MDESKFTPTAEEALQLAQEDAARGGYASISAQSICWLVFFARATIWQSASCGLPVWMPASCTQR